MSLIEKNTTLVMEDGKEFFVIRKIGEVQNKVVYNIAKRVFDFVASLAAILLLAVPMLVIALLIVVDSPGGAVYSQKRLGLNGKEFTLYKFRTMRADAEKNGAQWASENDDRCTSIGRFLRSTRLDELMQLFNILKGDMSIVGPRPEREVFYDKFRQYIDGFDQRLCVLPGLTGLAQVSGGYDLRPHEKVAFDLEYIETRGMWLDIKIIFKTVSVIFSHEGAR